MPKKCAKSSICFVVNVVIIILHSIMNLFTDFLEVHAIFFLNTQFRIKQARRYFYRTHVNQLLNNSLKIFNIHKHYERSRVCSL